MKYQQLVSAAILGAAATVSASPLAAREDAGQCPAGYSMTTWVVTVTATPSTPSTLETTVTPTSSVAIVSGTSAPGTSVTPTSLAVVVSSQVPSETAPSTSEGEAAVSVSSAPTSTSETPVPESTQVLAAATASTESSAVVDIVPTPSSTSQETSPTQTSTSSTSPTESPAIVTVAPTSSSTSQETSFTETSTSSSTSTAQPVSTPSSVSLSSSGTSGEATFYGGNVAGGTCSFSGYTLPSSLFGTALSVDMWDDASKCGACVAVTGPGGNTIKAMIVDQCPSCATNHFDLFENAFSELSALSTGVIDITWSYTSCDLNGPLQLKNKAGTSAYWFSMQVVNANEPVTSLEVSTDGGNTWQGTGRTYYNYFENEAGFGTDTVDVRVTGESGSSVVVKGVKCASGVEVTADSNF